jgi:drug/metabolite transporter (DMT)-like permease
MPPSVGLRHVDLRAAALVTLMAFLWAGNPIAIKISLADAPPIRQAWMRFIFGGLTVLAWAWITRTPLRVERREIRPLLILGLIFTIQIGLLNLGVKFTSAAHVAILLNAYPIYTVLLAHYFVPGDRLTGWRGVGVVLAYAGVVLLFSKEFSLRSAYRLGDLLISGSACLLGVRTVYLNRAVQRIEPVKLLLAQVAFGIPCYLVWSTAFEAAEPSRWTWGLLASLLYQGVVVAGFNFILNLHLLKKYKPGGLASYFLATPVFGVFQSWLVLGEALSARLLLAAGLVVAGITLASRRPEARKPQTVASDQAEDVGPS